MTVVAGAVVSVVPVAGVVVSVGVVAGATGSGVVVAGAVLSVVPVAGATGSGVPVAGAVVSVVPVVPVAGVTGSGVIVAGAVVSVLGVGSAGVSGGVDELEPSLLPASVALPDPASSEAPLFTEVPGSAEVGPPMGFAVVAPEAATSDGVSAAGVSALAPVASWHASSSAISIAANHIRILIRRHPAR